MTSKGVTIYGFVSITVMLILLILIWLRLVPESWYWPFFVIAALMFLSRIILRFKAARDEKRPSIPDGDPPA